MSNYTGRASAKYVREKAPTGQDERIRGLQVLISKAWVPGEDGLPRDVVKNYRLAWEALSESIQGGLDIDDGGVGAMITYLARTRDHLINSGIGEEHLPEVSLRDPWRAE